MTCNIEKLLSELNIKSNNLDLYKDALTYIELNKIPQSYTKLEFLGEAIISKIISCHLLIKGFDEIQISDKRNILVRPETLAKAFDDKKIITYVSLCNKVNVPIDIDNIVKGNIFKSLIGAIYIDVGKTKVNEILNDTIIKYYGNIESEDRVEYNNIKELLSYLNIKSKNLNIYKEALTNSGYRNENPGAKDYERLEFLGDCIISKIVSYYLYQTNPSLNEGEMSINKAKMIKGSTLTKASKEWKLIDYALLDNGLRTQLANQTITETKLYEDLFESMIAAIYLDVGEAKVFSLLKDTIIKYFNEETI